jgi:hypothetical protein
MWSFENVWCEKDDDEVWKLCTYPLVEPNSYYISSYGQIKNALTGRILKQYPLVRDVKTENVYYIIKLKFLDMSSNSIRYKNFRVNRLVAWEFCDNPNNFTLVEHINDNKLDNYYKNLKWSTHGENTRNSIKTHRLNISGENNVANIYSETLVHFLCGLMEEGKTDLEVLKIWQGKNATSHTHSKQWKLVYDLRAKTKFTDICVQYNYDAIFRLTKADKKILEYIEKGLENKEIMTIYGYEKISDNTALYTRILRCRKIYKIRSTTREKLSN